MDCVQLQDWVTVRSASTALTVTQNEPLWLDTNEHRDIVFWLDLRNITSGGGTDLTLAYETAPTKDEALFGTMAARPLLFLSAGLSLTSIIADQNPSLPLCGWVRWKLTAVGPSAEWGATFRIHCSLNARGGP